MTKQKTVSLSQHLNVSRRELERLGVFDSTLGIDTQLFIDPKLLISSDIPEFENSRQRILNYLTKVLRIHRQSSNSPRLQEIAVDMLAVAEPVGLSIGYGSKTDDGTSISRPVARKILSSASEMLSIGIEDVEVVELLGLFVKGFGPDSMSDLTAHIVYEELCKYTARISVELEAETREYKIGGKKYLLPTHPFSAEQIIFVPYKLLRELPIATSWREVAHAAAHNESLRRQFNKIVFPVLKDAIDDISAKTQKEIQSFKASMVSLLQIYRQVEVKPYDLVKDAAGYYQINPFVENQAPQIQPSAVPKNGSELIASIAELIAQFKRSIEHNGGNTLLYRKTDTGGLIKTEPHNEDVAQKIFYMLADLFCQKANILLTGESNAGRGPVDFSLGTAYDKKVLVEIKKSDNNSLVNGFTKQVKAYHQSENALHSFYVIIIVKELRKRKGYTSKLDAVMRLYDDNKKRGIKSPQLIIIDGLVYASPSKL